MIEEIKLLIPLFEGAANGAMWAFAAYLIYRVITIAMFYALCAGVLRTVYLIALRFVPFQNVRSVYQFNGGPQKISAIFDIHAFRDLLASIGTKGIAGGALVSNADIERAIAKMKKTE